MAELANRLELEDLRDNLREVQDLLHRQEIEQELLARQEMPRHALVEQLVHQQHLVALQSKLEGLHPADIAFILESLPLQARLLVWTWSRPIAMVKSYLKFRMRFANRSSRAWIRKSWWQRKKHLRPMS